ncbi:MAG: HD domain-containing protein [Patescibacteria group bacterium]
MSISKKLIIKDRLYGTQVITEPVLIALLKTKAVLRLKKINQFGVPDKYYHQKNFNRYEHSVGVMMLLRILGASVEEQVAGLLHDISHTAFSHVYDWIIGEAGDENYQDKQTENSINSKEIGGILKKYGYLPQAIADHHRFKLLESDIPEICADRIDYSLRELAVKKAKPLIKSLTKVNNKIVFKDKKSAHAFALNFLTLQKQHWGGFEAVSRYKIFSNLLKLAIAEGTLNLRDFLQNDDYVIKKLLKTKNPHILSALKILEKKKIPKSGKTECVSKKFRHTDPEFISKQGTIKLSEAIPSFKKYLEEQRIYNMKGTKVPIFNL